MLSTIEFSCSQWPETQTFGCTPGGDWKSLAGFMSLFDFAGCERLCLNEQEFGCCYLNMGIGCYWRPNSYSTETGNGGGTGIAITCTSGSGQINIELLDVISTLYLLYFSRYHETRQSSTTIICL